MKVPSLYKKLKQKRNAEKSRNQAQTRRTWIQLKMYEFYDWKYKPTTIKNGKVQREHYNGKSVSNAWTNSYPFDSHPSIIFFSCYHP